MADNHSTPQRVVVKMNTGDFARRMKRGLSNETQIRAQRPNKKMDGWDVKIPTIAAGFKQAQKDLSEAKMDFHHIAYTTTRMRHEGLFAVFGGIYFDNRGQLKIKQGDRKLSPQEENAIIKTTGTLLPDSYRPYLKKALPLILKGNAILHPYILKSMPALAFGAASDSEMRYLLGSLTSQLSQGDLKSLDTEAIKGLVEMGAVLGATSCDPKKVIAKFRVAQDFYDEKSQVLSAETSPALEEYANFSINKIARLDFLNPLHRMPLLPPVHSIMRDGKFDAAERRIVRPFIQELYTNVPDLTDDESLVHTVSVLNDQRRFMQAAYETIFGIYSTEEVYGKEVIDKLRMEVQSGIPIEGRTKTIYDLVNEQYNSMTIPSMGNLAVQTLTNDQERIQLLLNTLDLLKQANIFADRYCAAFFHTLDSVVEEGQRAGFFKDGDLLYTTSMRTWNGLFGSPVIEERAREMLKYKVDSSERLLKQISQDQISQDR